MSRHLQREIDGLKKRILGLGAAVEEALYKAMAALERRDAALAEEVQTADEQIDRVEVEIEEECLKVLALHQPVAQDLRFIITVMKMDDELERIGDLASNIAGRAQFLASREPIEPPYDIARMAEVTRWMLKRSLDAMVNLDIALAREVWLKDHEVDAIHRASYGLIRDAMVADPSKIESLIHLLSVGRFLERIADHSTSIAKDVIYTVEGEIVRHRAKEFRDQPAT